MAQETADQKRQLTLYSDIVTFMFAGRSCFTIHDHVSDKAYTYKITRAPNDKQSQWGKTYWVSIRSDDDIEWLYVGFISQKNGFRFTTSRNSVFHIAASEFQFFKTYYQQLRDNHATQLAPQGYDFWHGGRCGCCYTAIKPQDFYGIRTGYGPPCRDRATYPADVFRAASPQTRIQFN